MSENDEANLVLTKDQRILKRAQRMKERKAQEGAVCFTFFFCLNRSKFFTLHITSLLFSEAKLKGTKIVSQVENDNASHAKAQIAQSREHIDEVKVSLQKNKNKKTNKRGTLTPSQLHARIQFGRFFFDLFLCSLKVGHWSLTFALMPIFEKASADKKKRGKARFVLCLAKILSPPPKRLSPTHLIP
jgi:hypothetical protein